MFSKHSCKRHPSTDNTIISQDAGYKIQVSPNEGLISKTAAPQAKTRNLSLEERPALFAGDREGHVSALGLPTKSHQSLQSLIRRVCVCVSKKKESIIFVTIPAIYWAN